MQNKLGVNENPLIYSKGYTNKTILLMDMYVADEKTIKMQFCSCKGWPVNTKPGSNLTLIIIGCRMPVRKLQCALSLVNLERNVRALANPKLQLQSTKTLTLALFEVNWKLLLDFINN